MLALEFLSEEEVYTHVSAVELCNQAMDNVPVSLGIRYKQAEDHIQADGSFKIVKGKQ